MSAQGSSQSGPLLAPAEILIAIHGIDPEKDGIPLKKACHLFVFLDWKHRLVAIMSGWITFFDMQITDACNACFEQRQIFTQQVLAKVLNQLVCANVNFINFLLPPFSSRT